MRYDNPLTVRFPLKGRSRAVTVDDDVMTVGPLAKMFDVRKALRPALKGHDYVMLDFPDGSAKNDYQRSHTDMVEGAIRSATFKSKTPILERYDGQAYLVGGVDFSADKRHAIDDGEVLARHGKTGISDWQKYQADALAKICQLNGLSDEHKALLMDPGRGLEEADLAQFHDWKTNQPVSPHVVGGDMVGIPGIACRTTDRQFYKDGKLVSDGARSLMTSGYTGIAIPMRNIDGVSPRFQIMVDPSPMTVQLKMKSPEGDTITRSDYMDGNKKNYTLTMDGGEPARLACVGADLDHITFKDAKGEFRCKLKEDVLPILHERGYDIPMDTVASVKPQIGAKYSWLSPGDMVGSTKEVGSFSKKERESLRESFHDELGGLSDDDLADCHRKIRDLVSPAQDGFVRVRDPKIPDDDRYVAVICEGALKGVIAGKYLTVPDANDKTAADAIAGPTAGLVLVQVPGVAGAFMKTATPLYDHVTSSKGEPGRIVGTVIAMDADGAKNRSVARGVKGAEETLSKFGNGHVSVLCWDPEQKGIDDALLSVAHGEHTIDDIGFKFGSANELFPISKAQHPITRLMDGSIIKQDYRDHDRQGGKAANEHDGRDQAAKEHGGHGQDAGPLGKMTLGWKTRNLTRNGKALASGAKEATLGFGGGASLKTFGKDDMSIRVSGIDDRILPDYDNPNGMDGQPVVKVAKDGSIIARVGQGPASSRAIEIVPDGSASIYDHDSADAAWSAFDTKARITPDIYHSADHISFAVEFEPGHDIDLSRGPEGDVIIDDNSDFMTFPEDLNPDRLDMEHGSGAKGTLGFDLQPEDEYDAPEMAPDQKGTPGRPSRDGAVELDINRHPQRRLADFDDEDDGPDYANEPEFF